MARNGAGVYSIPIDQFVADTDIVADDMNTLIADIGTALTGSIAANGETTISANLKMSGYKHTGVADASANDQYVTASQLIKQGLKAWTTGGTSTAFTLTPTPALAALVEDAEYAIEFNAAAGTTPTLAVSGLTAKDLKYRAAGGVKAAITSAQVPSGWRSKVVYDGTDWIVLTPAGSKETIWIPAGALITRTTAGAASGTTESATNKVMIKTMDFDQTTVEYAQAFFQMPKSWNAGTLTAQFVWSSAISGTNAVMWAAQLLALSDDDAIDTAFGTAQTVTDAQTAVGDIMRTAETSAITAAGTPAESDCLVLQIYRNASDAADTLAGDARLHGVALFYNAVGAGDA